jgi:hypothetical protein
MPEQHNLHLHEELLLLMMRDKEGTPSGSFAMYAICGALLAELAAKGVIKIGEEPPHPVTVLKRRNVGALRSTTTHEMCVDLLQQFNDDSPIQGCIACLAQSAELYQLGLQQLCDRGILRQDERKVLFFFTDKIYPEQNPEPERAIVSRIRETLFSDGPVEPRTAVLIAFAHKTNTLYNCLTPEEIKERWQRIEAIAAGQVESEIVDATMTAITASQAAVSAAVAASTMIMMAAAT